VISVAPDIVDQVVAEQDHAEQAVGPIEQELRQLRQRGCLGARDGAAAGG
jgi:hypothetical protein